MKQQKNFIIGLVTVLSMAICTTANAQYHGHSSQGGYWGYSGPGVYLSPGPGYYPGWGGPNVIINVPIAPIIRHRPYVRECEEVEVCNQYDECWLERDCY